MNLREWCRNNWNRLDSEVRKKCVDHLDGWIPQEIILEWKKKDYESEPGFHMFGGGMQIRNRLRDVLPDSALPIILTSFDGSPYGSKNWDDYYTGALDELIERYS
jgi:hypothetical protein